MALANNTAQHKVSPAASFVSQDRYKLAQTYQRLLAEVSALAGMNWRERQAQGH